jgi:hypothetical protein
MSASQARKVHLSGLLKKIEPTAARFSLNFILLPHMGLIFARSTPNGELSKIWHCCQKPGNFKGNQTAVCLIFFKSPLKGYRITKVN